MDGSLASIFMNPALAQRPLCGSNEWSAMDTQCPEELHYNLICASMELQRAKAAAKEEEKIQEAKLHHLQELLTIISKERDEARDECKKLRECLLSQQSSSSADSPCSFINSSPMASSPASSPWSLQELEEHLNSDNFCEFPKVPAPLELQQTLQSFSQSCNDEHGFQALFSIEPTCESILENSESAFSLDMLEQGSPFDADPSLNLAELEQSKEAMQSVCESTQSTRALSRQSSSNSSSASVQIFEHAQSLTDLTDSVAPSLTSVKVEGVEAGTDAYMPSSMGDNVSFPVATSTSSKVLPLTGNSPTITLSPSRPVSNPADCAEGVPAMKATNMNMQVIRSQSPPNVSLAAKQANTTVVRQVHLPEPPEADPQVMLSSLPEKGKLLQAVMQAGPLLQTLLLAGPLPQWRHPPPALCTGDIPKVSMAPSINLILPYPHASMVQGHIKYLTPGANGASPPAMGVRAAHADSCARPKKLRKLSPASPHQSQLMHMWSGEGRMPVGVVSYPPTIY